MEKQLVEIAFIYFYTFRLKSNVDVTCAALHMK